MSCRTPRVFSASSAWKNISRRSHDLLVLLNLCVRVEPLWSAYAPTVDKMSDYAVDFRYPGHAATRAQAKMALKSCRSIRAEARRSLGLKKLN
jgi:hypothetical protein